VKAGGASLVARVEPNVRAKVHEKIKLALNADRVHFFDNRTELAL
jgi:multiple sugar transport system ATP-binding protein